VTSLETSADAAPPAVTLLPPVRIAIAGQVGQGKSTLIGHLRQDRGSPPAGTSDQPSAALARRDYVFIDTPGRRDLLEDLASAASSADAAILVIDAGEGVRGITRRQAYLLHLFNIRQIAVAIENMDLVDFSELRFVEVKAEIIDYFEKLGVVLSAIVPIASNAGDNAAAVSERMPWYKGPDVQSVLEQFQAQGDPSDLPLRLPIQEVSISDRGRVLAGRVVSGTLRTGDTLLFSPSNKTAKVRAIETSNNGAPPIESRAGRSVNITLDEQIFVEPGEIASHDENPPKLSAVFRCTVFWLGPEALSAGKFYKLKLATQEFPVTVQSVEMAVDPDTLVGSATEEVGSEMAAEVVLRSRGIVALDEFRGFPHCGRFVLIDGEETVGGGIVSMEGYPDQRQNFGVKSENLTAVAHRVAAASRVERNGHAGGVLWFTGLSGSGKSTLAMAVEQHLFLKGYHVYVLDGDNVRSGLNANLGFSPDDRAENIRRIGEVAALFADAGILCITAFISPYRGDRDRVRQAAGDAYHEVYIDADLETCEQRDPKGLYRKARAGEIAEFTGVSAPYETPANPELTVESGNRSVEECVQDIVDYISRAFRQT